MDTLPQFPRSSSSYLCEQDQHVDVRFYDGRFTGISESQTLPRGFDYSLPMNMAHSHGGSQEFFDGLPLIDVRAWETLSHQPSRSFPCNSLSVPDDWQYSYLPLAGREYPGYTQSEWTTTPADAHAPRTPFVPGPPFPLVLPPKMYGPLPLSVDGPDLHYEDKASDDSEIFHCPLLSSNGTRCGALIPCNESCITTHLRSVHALRAKRLEVISCLWPRCECRIQAASMPRHIITLHVKTRFRCSYCGKSLTRKDGKLKHEKICPGKP
ncbi:hypothetical protein EDB19DRAFT_285483 [Suillus lakei]|nr:hypothetical protein EDB19DRAFT_285483 [Suillus lakei]